MPIIMMMHPGKFLTRTNSRQTRFGTARPRSYTRCNYAKESPVYEAPSVATAATELNELERLSTVVPDTLLLESAQSKPKAATVSCSTLHQLLNNPSIGNRQYELYEEVRIPRDKLIFRVPATWQGIQAVKQLEATGVSTQVFLVYSLVQGIAAMQAGASVVQPSVGRVRDWYNQHPGYIRDPKGPREDSGFASQINPGVILVQQLYAYAKKFHPRTAIMASGLRTKEEALALAGCDYLVLGPRILAELAATSTLQGYNDDLHASAADAGGVARVLSPEMAAAIDMTQESPLTETSFNEKLELAGKELLQVSLQGLVNDAESVLPYFQQLAVSAE